MAEIEDKFAKCNLTKSPADHVKAPLIEESPVQPRVQGDRG